MADNDERSARLKKLEQLGVGAYPARVERTHTCKAALDEFEALVEAQSPVSLVGRVRSIRRHGALTFLIIEDGTARIQFLAKKDALSSDENTRLKDCLDMGDFVEGTGALILSKTEEKTLLLSGVRIIAKALLPLPEQWHGLADVETRFRQRYLDLLSNPEVKQTFEARARIIRTLRTFFEERGFLEVETPILQPLAGGATARPFVTHHNALDQDMVLRIAPELYLKRLVVGGFERVFEFARCFRNEGIDHSHNPEFTMLEAYCAFTDYHGLMDMMQELFSRLVDAIHGSRMLPRDGSQVTFEALFKRVTFRDAVSSAAHIDIDSASNQDMIDVCKKAKISLAQPPTRPQLLDALFKKFVVPSIVNPTFIIDYPTELSPLSKKTSDNPRYVERFQLIIGGIELVNAFSEINDPIDQLERFADQQKNRETGDEEAHAVDMEYVTALEYGMPPTAGLGIGVDRLVALLTDRHSLKEVILFPTLRRKQE